MINKKPTNIANFNCTFGKENKPMLDYFTEIVLPAFLKQASLSKEQFKFEKVGLTIANGEYVLGGLIVKKTSLEVLSLYDENGNLVTTNKTYPSAPFSYFVINLKNHRMALTKNQKGSPNLSNFSRAARDALMDYVKLVNKERKEKNEELLPSPNLHVVAIPFKEEIKEALKNVKKINQMTLRFYPLNKDIIENDTVTELIASLRAVGSKTGAINYNTPSNRENVEKVLKDTKGLLRPSLKVEYDDDTRGTLNDESFTEVTNVKIDENNSLVENINKVVGHVSQKEAFNETSTENMNLYGKWYSKLEELYKKLLK